MILNISLTCEATIDNYMYFYSKVLGIFLMMVFLALGIYMVLFNLQKWNNQLVEQLDEYEDKPSVDAP